jgi:hypothetical protein
MACDEAFDRITISLKPRIPQPNLVSEITLTSDDIAVSEIDLVVRMLASMILPFRLHHRSRRHWPVCGWAITVISMNSAVNQRGTHEYQAPEKNPRYLIVRRGLAPARAWFDGHSSVKAWKHKKRRKKIGCFQTFANRASKEVAMS